jgi:hypothetical protein
MRNKYLKLLWVVLLVISSFVLGRYLNPLRTSQSPFSAGAGGFSGRPAPPLDFSAFGSRGR